MKEEDFYGGIYREVQDFGVTGWYVRTSHKLLERGLPNTQEPKILEVGGNIGEPEISGAHVKENVNDPRVEILFHGANFRIGGAVKSGYRCMFEMNSDVVVKVNGQIDTAELAMTFWEASTT